MPYNKAIKLQYVGTHFAGWQIQNGARTVQEAVNKALTKMYKTEIKCVGSGRTDSGVHAMAQVANFKSEKYLSDKAVLYGLNSILPEDVSVTEVWDVAENFHAQRLAKDKTYQYKIFPSPIRSAIHHNRAWWYKYGLDFDKADKLFGLFEGEHDFTSFCVQRSLKDNNIRKINYTKTFSEGDIFCFEINGNGFLHNMVRIIIGSIAEACMKGYDESYIQNALTGRDRELSGPTAPPEGLYLKSVNY
jgi:tRNA pseudouridine38-40 synthase